MTGRLRVQPLRGTGLPGDEAVEIDLAAPDRPRVEASGPGIVRVHARPPGEKHGKSTGEPDSPVRAAIGGLRTGPGGESVVEVVVDGWRFELEVEGAARAALRRRATREADVAGASGPTDIRAIIPGRVAAIRVADGDVVVAGQALLVIEAMKMQNELRAPRDGTVERVAVREADRIDNGDLLMVLR